MNIKKKCEQINSLLGDLSSTGIIPIPQLVYDMRQLLHKIEEAAQQSVQADGAKVCPECGSEVSVCMMGHYCGEKTPRR